LRENKLEGKATSVADSLTAEQQQQRENENLGSKIEKKYISEPESLKCAFND
jgi:hypothetical protein